MSRSESCHTCIERGTHLPITLGGLSQPGPEVGRLRDNPFGPCRLSVIWRRNKVVVREVLRRFAVDGFAGRGERKRDNAHGTRRATRDPGRVHRAADLSLTWGFVYVGS